MTAILPHLRGSIVPLVTPMTQSGHYDEAGADALIDRVRAGGARGLVLLGTTGEFALVPPSLRGQIIAHTKARCGGDLALIVSCGRPSIAETVAELEEAEGEGADACLVAPSFYLSLGMEEILRQYAALRASCGLPLLYYHIPVRTQGRGGAETVRRLHAEGLICGLKDSGGPNPAFQSAMLAIRASDPGFQVMLGGSSALLQAAAMGVETVTSATGCIAPQWECAVLSAVAAGDTPKAAAAQQRLIALIQLVLTANPENAAVGTKGLLAALGVCQPWPLPPFAAADETWRRHALSEFEELRLGNAA